MKHIHNLTTKIIDVLLVRGVGNGYIAAAIVLVDMLYHRLSAGDKIIHTLRRDDIPNPIIVYEEGIHTAKWWRCC